MKNKKIFLRIKAITERLKKEYKAEKVILFGSYARGEETVDSDIDFLIIAPTQEKFFHRMASVRRIIRDLRSGLPVAPIVLTSEELKERVRIGDQFIKEILEKGLSL